MTKKASTIYNFPLEEFKKDWPFNGEILRDLFNMNSSPPYPYSSLKEFFEGEEYNPDEYRFFNFFIENDQVYYKVGLDSKGNLSNKVYTLENIPYSFLVCNAIKYELIYFGTFINGIYHWPTVFEYLLFSPFPVLKVLEKGNFIKTMKRPILKGFSLGFQEYQRGAKSKIEKFFSNSVIKNTSDSLSDSLTDSVFIIGSAEEKLYNILLYSEIPEKKAKALTEKSFVIKNFSAIYDYYQELLNELKSSDYT